MNLTNVTLEKIFGPENKELTYEEWKNLFARHSIDYMLSAPGVRANLEINNV